MSLDELKDRRLAPGQGGKQKIHFPCPQDKKHIFRKRAFFLIEVRVFYLLYKKCCFFFDISVHFLGEKCNFFFMIFRLKFIYLGQYCDMPFHSITEFIVFLRK